MRDVRHQLRALLTVVILVVAASGTAMAHKINVFATNTGAEVSGEVYVTTSSKVAGAGVRVLAPDGSVLLETTTDDEGQFRFTAPCRADLRIRVLTPDGHAAEWTVPAADLPPSLAAWESGGEVAAQPQSDSPVADSDVLRKIESLERRIQEYKEEMRLHDILGGIGYIIGMAGIAFYFSAKKSGGAQNTP